MVQRLEVVPVPGSHGSYYGSYCGIRRDGQALDRNNITKELDYVGVLREITWCTYNRVMEQGKDTAVVCWSYMMYDVSGPILGKISRHNNMYV